jgi:aerobic carbon-monoxide dehydrogenase small subunit
MLKIKFAVNNKEYIIEVADSLRLIDILRDSLGLTGTKEGCGVGECGACTVIMNGEAICSCLVLAGQLEGATIETIENLEKDNTLTKLQKLFLEHGAIQCGFCSPGMLMSTKALLDKNSNPSEAEIKEALEGNLCRCTGYIPIINAVKAMTINNV